MSATNEASSVMKGGFTIQEAVEYSGFSRTRIYAEVGSGNLTAKKAGRRTIIIGSSLQALLDNLPPAKIAIQKAA